MERRDTGNHYAIGSHHCTAANMDARQNNAACAEPRVILDNDGSLGDRSKTADKRSVGVGGGHQRYPWRDADAVANRDIAAFGQLLYDQQIVSDIDIAAD